MTTEPTPDRIAELEVQYLTALMLRDARIWGAREDGLNKLSMRTPMGRNAVAIKRAAKKLGYEGAEPAAFLVEGGWLDRFENGFVFIRKVCGLPGAKKAKRKSRAPASEEHREAERAMS